MAAAKPSKIIGLYGVSGSGKSYLIRNLRQDLQDVDFVFYEGAEVIDQVVPGGLKCFQKLNDAEKSDYRCQAIRKIRDETALDGKVAVVTGHFSFWNLSETALIGVMTPTDLEIYTHIIYLRTAPETVVEQRRTAPDKRRGELSASQIEDWQSFEIQGLRQVCNENGVLFTVMQPCSSILQRMSARLSLFRNQDESSNSDLAIKRLAGVSELDTDAPHIVVLDADKTLAPIDAGQILWSRLAHLFPHDAQPDQLKMLFGGPMGYSYKAFCQASLLYTDVATQDAFNIACDEVSRSVQLYPEMDAFLRQLCTLSHVRVVIITCGLADLWKRAVSILDLPRPVCVVGASFDDGFVVTPKVKGAIVSCLRKDYGKTVYAFGDSCLDIDMLEQASEARIIVGDMHIRSKSMDAALWTAVNERGLRAQQILLPDVVVPRLNLDILPVTTLTRFLSELEETYKTSTSLIDSSIIHFTDHHATKILSTLTRDSTISGPMLRKHHESIGEHLALMALTEVIGIEMYEITHVQGGSTPGYRIRDGTKTTIVALMRGGEPMAFGVNELIPSAMFVHAKGTNAVQTHHVHNQTAIIIVDSVVNTGATVRDFVKHIRCLSETVQIVVVVGVVQQDAVQCSGTLGQVLLQDNKIKLIALRLSKNKYKGSGSTDTGNRLFNTQHLV